MVEFRNNNKMPFCLTVQKMYFSKIFLLIVLLYITFHVANGWFFFRRRQRTNSRRTTNTATLSKATIPTSTIFSGTQKCVDFRLNNNQIGICSQILNYNCTQIINMSPSFFNQLNGTKKLNDIQSLLGEKCGCKNQTIELLCRYSFPQCSINSENCETSVTYTPNVTLPCSEYCHKLVNR